MYNNNFSNRYSRNNNLPKSYNIIARYKSKYGLILYCSVVPDGDSLNLDQCFIHTLYYKGANDYKSGDIATFSTITDQSGKVYCFEVLAEENKSAEQF